MSFCRRIIHNLNLYFYYGKIQKNVEVCKIVRIKNIVSYKVFVYLFILSICFIIVIPSVLYYDNHSQAGVCLREAKNIQLAMKILFVEYYGNNRNIYTPNTQYGMMEDTVNEILDLSGAVGEITLVSWNIEERIPGKFYYLTDKFLVIYEYDAEAKEPTWTIYNSRQVMELGK